MNTFLKHRRPIFLCLFLSFFFFVICSLAWGLFLCRVKIYDISHTVFPIQHGRLGQRESLSQRELLKHLVLLQKQNVGSASLHFFYLIKWLPNEESATRLADYFMVN